MSLIHILRQDTEGMKSQGCTLRKHTEPRSTEDATNTRHLSSSLISSGTISGHGKILIWTFHSFGETLLLWLIETFS